jgi:hypothetical protein
MPMVKIRISGERGNKALLEMGRTGRAFRVSNQTYLVPESVLKLLSRFGADFRLLRIDGFPEKSFTDGTIESLERHCGKLVVRKVGQSETIAYQHLSHPKPKYRSAALVLIYLKWGPTPEVADVCEEFVASDPDADVRALAATTLGRYYVGSGNMRIGDLLARIVYDDNEDRQVRQSAYWSLYSLQEEFDWDQPSILDFRFPDDIDWNFVGCFLRQSTIKRLVRRLCRIATRVRFRRSTIRP